MLIFNEGLPRSGKSHDAVKNYIIPMLKKGRKVFTNIAGVNHAQIAALVGISEDECRALLIQLTSEQIPEIYKHVEKDSFVIIDELQDFFFFICQKLGPEITTFVTQHGHEGLDMLLMGQFLADCHSMWRNRVAQKNYFFKREAIGKPDEYTVTTYKPVPKGKTVDWAEVSKQGPFTYDPLIYGCYKSHSEGTTNTEILMDDRANIWHSPLVRKWLPLIGFMIVVAVVYLGYVFKGGGLEKSLSTKPAPVAQAQKGTINHAPAPVQNASTQQPKSQQLSVPKDFMPDEPKDLIDEMSGNYRVRLSGTVRMRGITKGYIEWRDESSRLYESLSIDDLAGLGWMVFVNNQGTMAIMQRNSRRYIVTAWPLPDMRGEVPENSKDNLRDMPLAPSSPSAIADASGAL